MGSSGGLLGGLTSLIPGIGPLLSTGLGALGLIQGSNQAAEASNERQQALAAQQPQINAQNSLYNLASTYNPAQQDAQAFTSATSQANQTLNASLKQLNGQFGASGGSPTGDTAFNVGAANTANNVLNPLRTWMAGQVATEPQRQAQMYDNVFSAPSGQISNAYFNAANQTTPSPNSFQASLGQLVQGLQGTQAPSSGLSTGFNTGTPQGNYSDPGFLAGF